MGEVRRKLPVIFIPFTGQLSAVPPTAWKLLTPTRKASYLYDSSPDILIMLLVLVGSIHWFHVSVLQEVVFQLLGYNLSCTVDNSLKKQNKTNQKSHIHTHTNSGILALDSSSSIVHNLITECYPTGYSYSLLITQAHFCFLLL